MVNTSHETSVRPIDPSTIEARTRQIHRFINKMPRLSTTVAKVVEICNGPAANASELNRVISYDPVLTGQLIRLVNSAYYGLSNRVTSLTRAIIMLGINTVKNMVLTTNVLSNFKGHTKIAGMSVDDFWAHCLGVGVIAKTIARQQQLPANVQEELFIAGLMHDLGKIPIMTIFSEQYREAIEMTADAQLPLHISERACIGMDHCEVGRLIGKRWKLANGIRMAMEKHHDKTADPVDENGRIWSIPSLANQMSKSLSIGFAGDADIDMALIDELSEMIGMQYSEFAQMHSEIEAQIKKAVIFLQVAV